MRTTALNSAALNSAAAAAAEAAAAAARCASKVRALVLSIACPVCRDVF